MDHPKVPVCIYLAFLSGCLAACLAGLLTYAAGENIFYALLAGFPALFATFLVVHRIIAECRCRAKEEGGNKA